MNTTKRVVITIGDPAGCGPYVVVKAIENVKQNVKFIVVGDRKILTKVAGYKNIEKRIELIDVKTYGIEKITLGYPTRLSGEASLNYIDTALKIINKNKGRIALVTAPVSKEAIRLVYPSFVGHTEYLANFFKVKKFLMMMVSKRIRVVLFSRHIPLREVPFYLSKDRFKDTIELTYRFLKDKFKIRHPKIVVSSVNPHAGLDTFLEKEEKIMLKAIQECRLKIEGPYPADTLFVESNLKKYDCVICAYHDQAMIPFKLLSFKEGVNLTVGLPIIRTSPSHGVAFPVIRSKSSIFFTSMLEAIKLALKLI